LGLRSSERLVAACDCRTAVPGCGAIDTEDRRLPRAIDDAGAHRCPEPVGAVATWRGCDRCLPRTLRRRHALDRTPGVRGLMPAEFFGTMFYSPDREHSLYDFGPHEPGFSWLFRPLGPIPGDIDPDDNRISLTINDDARADEMTKDKTRLYRAFRAENVAALIT
jgi:hypothetical protein